MDLYDIARQVTDEVLGEGTYATINKDHPDPGVQAAIQRAPQEPHKGKWGVLVGDNPIHYQPGEGDFDGMDDLEVRGPFDTKQEAQDYAFQTMRYVCVVVPLTEPIADG